MMFWEEGGSWAVEWEIQGYLLLDNYETLSTLRTCVHTDDG